MSATLTAIEVLALLPARTGTTAANGPAINLLPFDGDLLLILDATAATGGTLDAVIQTSSDGTTWTDSGLAFPLLETAPTFATIKADADQFRRFIRLSERVKSGTPTATRAACLVARRRV